MVICLERGVNLHMAQLMPLPLTISCSSKIQIGFTILVPAHLGSLGPRAVKRVCVLYASHVLPQIKLGHESLLQRAHEMPFSVTAGHNPVTAGAQSVGHKREPCENG